MTAAPSILHLVVPGSLKQRTGGYLYDARMADGLRSLGWTVRVHCVPGRFPGPNPETARALRETLGALPSKSAVVVDGLALGGYPEAAEAEQRRLRLIALVHHPLCDETGLSIPHAARLEALERRALAACGRVIVSSPFTRERVAGWLRDSTRIRAVLPGTDRAERARGPGSDEPPRLLCVGALVPRKGQDVLLQALTVLPPLPWDCILAGSLDRDPAYVAHVRALATNESIAGRVHLAGECSEPELMALYASGSLFVLPSWYEGYGMAFAEAMAHGLPIVGTTGGAIPHTVPPTAGVLVEPGDTRAIAEAIARVLRDPVTRLRLGEAAWQHAAALPDWQASAGAFAAAVQDLAAP